jgi:hypothetical protein
MLLGACACLIALALFSCATAPKKAPEQPQQPAVTEPAPQPAPVVEQAPPAEEPAAVEPEPVAAPDDLKSQAETLRKRVYDLTLNDLLKDDTAKADTAFFLGKDTFGKDNEASTAAYTDAVDQYTAIIDKGLPILADQHRARAAATRDTTSKTDASELFPDGYPIAESSFQDAQARFDSSDFENSIPVFDTSNQLFLLLYKGTLAKKSQDLIAERGYDAFDPGNFQLASDKYQEALSLYNVDNGKALIAADEALLRYNMTIEKGRDLYLAGKKGKADDSRQLALSIKADVAVKDDFSVADTNYRAAIDQVSKGNIEAAADQFDTSTTMFTDAYARAKDKREKAVVAMQATQEQRVASESLAKEAELKMGIVPEAVPVPESEAAPVPEATPQDMENQGDTSAQPEATAQDSGDQADSGSQPDAVQTDDGQDSSAAAQSSDSAQ